MISSDDAARLASIAAALQAEPGEVGTVQAILTSATTVVPDAEHVSLTVRERRKFVTLGASSAAAEEADQLQYELREGPCVDIATDAEWLRSGDVGHDARWPRWGPRVADAGMRSLMCVPLTARGERLGALNLYSTTPQRFDEPSIHEAALLYAVHAGYALSSARLVTGLETAVGSRHLIGLAQGILVERYRMSADQAFALLRRVSSLQNRRLRDIADELVRTGTVAGFELPTRAGAPGAETSSAPRP